MFIKEKLRGSVMRSNKDPDVSYDFYQFFNFSDRLYDEVVTKRYAEKLNIKISQRVRILTYYG